MTDKRDKWLTEKAAYEQSVRMLHRMYPDSPTYAAQVRVLDQINRLKAEHAVYRETLALMADGEGDVAETYQTMAKYALNTPIEENWIHKMHSEKGGSKDE